jgi:DNA-binding transcriptional LysR family regulator
MKTIHPDFDRLNLNLLRVFEVIYRERNLTRAADVLSLTPSAVSHSLRQLREFYQDALFQRNGLDMVPTPFCAALAPEILREMASLRDVVQRWGRFDPEASTTTFSLAMPEPLEAILLPGLTAHLAKIAPGVRIVSTGNDRRHMATSLQRGLIDLAIDVALPTQPLLKRKIIAESAWCVLVRQGHPFASKGDAEAYCKAGHVAVSARAFGSVLEDVHLESMQIERRTTLRCQSYFNAMEVVGASDLLLTMPRQPWYQAQRETIGLEVVPLPFDLPQINVYMYWHADHQSDHRKSWLREIVCDSFSLAPEPG